MAISTNSVIHYTSSLKRLKSIMIEGFKVKYCFETILTSERPLTGAFPMVCFCDIPLSNVKDHLRSYGHYGIGLSKKWASANGINPVLYLDKTSGLSGKLFKQGLRSQNDQGIVQQEWLDNFMQICSYIKNYDGELLRKTKRFLNYRFYNEREWRYIPNTELLTDFPNAVAKAEYLKDKVMLNEKAAKIKLVFNFNDISYIIVKNEKEISSIAKHIKESYKNKCSEKDLEILLSKILTTYQIKNDF